MDSGLVTNNVTDPTTSHITTSKTLNNVTLKNRHTTLNNSATRIPFSNNWQCATSNNIETQPKTLVSHDTTSVERTLVNDSSQAHIINL
jgi:hypothetical protein